MLVYPMSMVDEPEVWAVLPISVVVLEFGESSMFATEPLYADPVPPVAPPVEPIFM